MVLACVLRLMPSPVDISSEASDEPSGESATVQVYTDWPFDADEARRRQQETAKVLKQPVVLETPIGSPPRAVLSWHLIPAGKFMMGSPNDEPGHEGDERLRPETISQPFYMLETQLTFEQYHALLGGELPEGSEAKLPAALTYRETVDKVLPALARLAPAGWKVILPDQVRLEYAARAGVATMNPGGNQPEDAEPYAWTQENSEGKIHPVGQKRPNAWGLHDVIGNQWHWFWRAAGKYGDSSQDNHIVYGGAFRTKATRNGARLANLQISNRSEGARFALIPADAPVPEGHPEPGKE